MEKTVENNTVYLKGKVLSNPVFNHKAYGEVYYMLCLGVLRKSGYEDKIRVIIADSILGRYSPIKGDFLEVDGQIRTFNKEDRGKNTLEVTVYAKSIVCIREQEYTYDRDGENYENVVEFEGFLCKKPIRRTSPLGREICDLMVAVNRQYNKSDYIPTVAWGKNAAFCEKLNVGDKVVVWGRLQSREYRKFIEEKVSVTKTAYEVSVIKIEVEEECVFRR